MKLTFALALLLAAFTFTATIAVPTPAQAQRGVKSGYCPVGTCSENGGPWAKKVRKCAAKNCRGAGARAQEK